MFRFQTWHLFALIGAICFVAGAGRLFATTATPPAFQLTIYMILLVVSPAIALTGASLGEGVGKAFFVGGALTAFAPWFVAFYATMSNLPAAYAARGELGEIAPAAVSPTLVEMARGVFWILSPWATFLAGGGFSALLYLLLKGVWLLLVWAKWVPATISPRYLNDFE